MKLKDFDFRIWDGRKYVNNIKGGVYIHKKDTDVKCLNRNQDCYDYEFQLDDLDNSNLEIELFTGYYDYKGNKIYIGDIIECLVFTNEKNSEIFYEIICFDMELGLCSKLSNGDGGYLFDLRRHKNNKTIEDVYVVGNIHENKELLKG
ncbi:YopX family protein [Campylobacter coli]|uniref:YopX family protein n=1 Tax=Campylobacter coli TaxID=195 RepID=UPI001BFF9338|nr:YopX family protein [Campylobacter coli]